jgi:ATP-dependent RNA helicase DDX46/PRP5
MDEITERAGVTVISRGSYIAPGKKLEPGEKKLFLLIEGSSEMSVKFAKMEIQRALEEETLKLGASGSVGSFGRYSVT